MGLCCTKWRAACQGRPPRPPAPPQKKHVECAEALLGPGKELNTFVARLLEDIANLKAMLQAISIGECRLGAPGARLLAGSPQARAGYRLCGLAVAGPPAGWP